MATTDPTKHHRNFGSDVPVHDDCTPPHAEAMRIRHVLVDDHSVVLVENTWTVFHHRACFALRPRPRHFPLRSSFNAWRNVAVSAAARAPERAANGDEDDSHVDTAAVGEQRIHQGMHDVQTELRATSNALGEILRRREGPEEQRRRAAMDQVIADAAARHERFAEAISPNLHEDRDSSSEGLDDAQRHHEEVQDALHDAVVLAETEVADHDGLPVRRRVLSTEHF